MVVKQNMNLENISEKGMLAAAVVLSSIWLLAVPFIYLLLRSWRKKKKENDKLDTADTGESKDTL